MTLGRAKAVIAFSVSDTGIGIRRQAADYFGLPTGRRHHQPQVRHGLGLSISRELARFWWRNPVAERAGVGSTFTLYLPQAYMARCSRCGAKR